MVPCAYLRVFEPLDAFPAAERERWSRYVAAGRGVSVGAALETESRTAVVRLITGRPPLAPEAALVRRVGARIHLCPLQLAERQAVALLAFRDIVPEPVIDAFVSAEEAGGALTAVQRLYRPPHIQEASWEVPLLWFVAFGAEERHFVNPPEGRGPRLTYLTVARTALDRLDRAISVIEGNVADGEEMAESLTELVDWLASFDDDSLVELDYGGLAAIISEGELAIDLSCEELWDAIEALERRDAAVAMARYEAVSNRWNGFRSRCRFN